MTDRLVCDAQEAFRRRLGGTGGDDGYVSFEVDPLLEDPLLGPYARRTCSGNTWLSEKNGLHATRIG